MTITDWVAVIGALAWTPPIIKYIKDVFTKPEVLVIAQPFSEVGFTYLGPIFNLRLALSVKNQDLVLTGIRAHIRNELGETRVFEWQGIVQRMGHMNYPEVGAVPFEKESGVLAIKIQEKDIEERFIRFQERTVIKRKIELEQIALKKLAYLKQQGEIDYHDFYRSQEITDLFRFIKQSSMWKEGRYSVTFELLSPQDFKVVDNKYEFYLSSVDIEILEDNKTLIEIAYENDLTPLPTGTPRVTFSQWAWRNPILTKSQ